MINPERSTTFLNGRLRECASTRRHRFNAADGIFVTHAAGLGHEIDGDVVVDADDNPLRDVLVTQFADGTVEEEIEGLLDRPLDGAYSR